MGAIRVNEADRREASEERTASCGSILSAGAGEWDAPRGPIAAASTRAGGDLLLDEDVFLSQLHRRAKLLNGKFDCFHKTPMYHTSRPERVNVFTIGQYTCLLLAFMANVGLGWGKVKIDPHAVAMR